MLSHMYFEVVGYRLDFYLNSQMELESSLSSHFLICFHLLCTLFIVCNSQMSSIYQLIHFWIRHSHLKLGGIWQVVRRIGGNFVCEVIGVEKKRTALLARSLAFEWCFGHSQASPFTCLAKRRKTGIDPQILRVLRARSVATLWMKHRDGKRSCTKQLLHSHLVANLECSELSRTDVQKHKHTIFLEIIRANLFHLGKKQVFFLDLILLIQNITNLDD